MKNECELKGDIKIGQRVKAYRIKQHLTQKELAELVHISSSSITRLETGKIMVSVFTMIDIASVLKVSIAELLTDIPPDSEEARIGNIMARLEKCKPNQRVQIINGIELILDAVMVME